MMRNEYRRALIMFRPLQRGFSGHVRLERRTTLGNMCFSANTGRCEGNLYAVLVGRRRDDYYAAALGELAKDRRGQAMLNAGFDPRNINGKPLEAYQLVTVVCVEGDVCRLALAGNINGSFEMNWTAVQNAACALFVRTVEPRNSEKTPEEIPKGMEGPEETGVFFDGEESVATLSVPQIDNDPEKEKETEAIFDGVENLTAKTGGEEKQTEVHELELETRSQAEIAGIGENSQTSVSLAADLLDISSEYAWRKELSAVRTLFETNVPFLGIAVQDYIFVRAPLPKSAGYPFCAIGVHAENGKPKSVCYALPSMFSNEPPPGLEGYVWCGEGNEGWWMIFLDAETSEELDLVP